MTIERLEPGIAANFGEPYASMDVDSTGSYLRVEDLIDRLSLINSSSHTTLQFRLAIRDLIEELT